MCGIAGRVNLFSGRPVDPETVRGMCARIRHRGPDDEGIWVDGAAGLGHRRLSIIDLSPAGHQPMRSSSGRYWLTFNGEIYNYRTIRAELEQRGVTFRSTSDTEVLVEAFEAFGIGCLARLRGMFAFAVWDTHERRLWLARDRVGKKPLSYRQDRDGVAFASEPKAFFADPAFEARPNLRALSAFLSLQYVPSPLSAFEGVQQLPPAHYLVADANGTRIERYWHLDYEPKLTLDVEEAESRLLALLREATRLRMISDVPLGAFLSGGIDSSLVVALMCDEGGQHGQVKTFSIGFEDSRFNELPYARMVAERYRTQHHEFVVTPDIRELLPQLVRQYDEPFGDSSAVPTWYLSQLTRAHVTVALNGDGGDENLAGYDSYAANPRNEVYDRLPAGLRQAVAATARWLPGEAGGGFARVRRWTAVRALDPARRVAMSRMLIQPEWKEAICMPDLLETAHDAAVAHIEAAFERAQAVDPLDRLLSMDFETYLPGALMPKVDIATMAFGLEGRSPFLDHEVLEFCARLPTHMKRQGTEGKWLLRRIARRVLPAQAIDRPKKGFAVPLARWFREDLREMLSDVLLDGTARTRGLLRQSEVRRLVEQHHAGAHDWHEPIWLMLMMELWCRQHLTPTSSAPAEAGATLAPA